MKYECEGQISIFDLLKPKECQFSKHTCNKTELWKIAHTLDDIECPEKCCRQCDVKMCGARCNGSEEPRAITPAEVGEWVKEHGKRIKFDDIKVDHYYIADYSTESHKWYKLVYVKWIEDDSIGYVDSEKGIKGKWTWGNNYSALTRKEYVDADRDTNPLAKMSDTNGWWYEIEKNNQAAAM